jgi:hypothetical protein
VVVIPSGAAGIFRARFQSASRGAEGSWLDFSTGTVAGNISPPLCPSFVFGVYPDSCRSIPNDSAGPNEADRFLLFLSLLRPTCPKGKIAPFANGSPQLIWCKIPAMSFNLRSLRARRRWAFAKISFFILTGFLLYAISSKAQHKPASSIEQCPGPWLDASFAKFEIGMRVPGGTHCLWQSARPKKYVRKTSTNEYLINPEYENDYTESRLHPATVLTNVSMTVDHPKPVLEILKDIPEIAHLCMKRCRILGLQTSSRNEAPRLIVFPEVATEEQKQLAERAASYHGISYRLQNPIPAVFLYWERLETCTHFDDDSLRLAITSLNFSVVDPSFPGQHPIDWKTFNCHEPGTTEIGWFKGS